MLRETTLKKSERSLRLIGEAGVCFAATYGQILLPRLGDVAAQLAGHALNYNLCLMSALYTTDLLLYTLAAPKMYDNFYEWGRLRLDVFYQRGLRDLSQILVSAGGMQLFYFAMLSGQAVPQIAVTAGLVLLKGIIESVLEIQEYHVTHDYKNMYEIKQTAF